MPSIASVLKDEITRLCKKELRSQLDPMRSASARYRSDIADLKRRLVVLERQNQKLQKQIPTPAQESTDEDRKLRFVAKGLATLRTRLGITVARCESSEHLQLADRKIRPKTSPA